MGSEDVVCAVCGTRVSYDDAYGAAEHEGDVYSVCSRACMESFRAQPQSYAQQG
jgi:YHS domain-containing protein